MIECNDGLGGRRRSREDRILGWRLNAKGLVREEKEEEMRKLTERVLSRGGRGRGSYSKESVISQSDREMNCINLILLLFIQECDSL